MYTDVVNPRTGINFYFVDYEEGVYVGYRYYETRAAAYSGAIEAIGEEEYESGEEWYSECRHLPLRLRPRLIRPSNGRSRMIPRSKMSP